MHWRLRTNTKYLGFGVPRRSIDGGIRILWKRFVLLVFHSTKQLFVISWNSGMVAFESSGKSFFQKVYFDITYRTTRTFLLFPSIISFEICFTFVANPSLIIISISAIKWISDLAPRLAMFLIRLIGYNWNEPAISFRYLEPEISVMAFSMLVKAHGFWEILCNLGDAMLD